MAPTQHKYTFKIEQKPEGGYILRSEHPPLVIEGATKEEVEAKLRAEFMKLMPEGIAKKLLELSQMTGVTVKTNVTVKEASPMDQAFSNPAPEPMLTGGPKAEPLISPKLVLVLLLLLGVAFILWRVLPQR